MEVNWTEAFDLSLEHHDEGHRHYNINKIAKIIQSSGLVILEKFVRGDIFSLISMDMMYVYKHILKKPMPNKKD
jgi:hypothetical protein